MRVSLIIAVYKDVEALSLIIEALRNQTYKNFEVIIAEDGNSNKMSEFVNSIKYLDVKHTTQEDIGVRKSRSQNNGILASSGEYLIFIDGDCIPYSTFIANHLLLSSQKSIVAGRRVNLGPIFSKQIRSRELHPLWLEKNFFKQYLNISKDAKSEKHTEEGFLIKPFGLIHKFILNKRKKNFPLLGCNFSCYKDSMYEINGFDEDLGNSAAAGDTDIEIRFKNLGYNIVVGRFIVNQFHLFHTRKAEDYNRAITNNTLSNNENKSICKNGIVKK